jgi:hypothetical protein
MRNLLYALLLAITALVLWTREGPREEASPDVSGIVAIANDLLTEAPAPVASQPEPATYPVPMMTTARLGHACTTTSECTVTANLRDRSMPLLCFAVAGTRENGLVGPQNDRSSTAWHRTRSEARGHPSNPRAGLEPSLRL